jgi:hypothetical protein
VRDIRHGVCPLCEHTEVIECAPREFSSGTDPHPLAAAHGVLYRHLKVYANADPSEPYGTLKLYVCRSCGYGQWFADRPDEIPINEESYGTRIVTGKKDDSPYR